MTELERRLAEIKADTNSINAEKEKLQKIHQDLMNQSNLLDLVIIAKIRRGEDVTEYLSKRDKLLAEMEKYNDRLDDLLERTKKLMIKSINLMGNFMF